MDRLYSPKPDGYCGDEDNGQTSAWYVFSALGFYPVCPASDEYAAGSPLFKKATIRLENGKTVEIEAPRTLRKTGMSERCESTAKSPNDRSLNTPKSKMERRYSLTCRFESDVCL